jgi:epoxide hydrolase-like predicted phosphatase
VAADGRAGAIQRATPSAASSERRDGGRTGREGAAREGLLLDWGGVMTGNLLTSFRAFCEAESLDPNALVGIFRENPTARELLFAFEEGRLEEAEFEQGLGEQLGLARADGLIDRLFSGSTPEDSMVQAVRAARSAGIRTGLISNSWGTHRYPRELLAELFDGIVLSGEVGIRKPTPGIYELGAQAIGVDPGECVFVDDLPFNLPPARELGMAVVHHTGAGTTIDELELLLGTPLRQGAS